MCVDLAMRRSDYHNLPAIDDCHINWSPVCCNCAFWDCRRRWQWLKMRTMALASSAIPTNGACTLDRPPRRHLVRRRMVGTPFVGMPDPTSACSARRRCSNYWNNLVFFVDKSSVDSHYLNSHCAFRHRCRHRWARHSYRKPTTMVKWFHRWLPYWPVTNGHDANSNSNTIRYCCCDWCWYHYRSDGASWKTLCKKSKLIALKREMFVIGIVVVAKLMYSKLFFCETIERQLERARFSPFTNSRYNDENNGCWLTETFAVDEQHRNHRNRS